MSKYSTWYHLKAVLFWQLCNCAIDFEMAEDINKKILFYW